MSAYINVNGESCLEAHLHVPNIGPWWADVIFEAAPAVSGKVALALGELALVGTILSAEDGTFGEQRRSRIVGGAGGWGTLVTAQHYHNDASVKALSVAQDAARLAGETLGAFAPQDTTLGFDYVRSAGNASRVLEDAIGTAAWWVDYAGVTQVGARTPQTPAPEDYQVLEFDPRENLATLAIDDLSAVGVGSVLSEGLDEPLSIHELEVKIAVDQSRTMAWGGGSLTKRGRLAQLLRGIVDRTTDQKLYGVYRYRVVQMASDRVNLQSVAPSSGVPDLLPVSMAPGVAGAHSSLTGGMIVLVVFLEGDRTLPRITSFEGKDGAGHGTASIVFTTASSIKLGGDGATEGVARGTSVQFWADSHFHTGGTISGNTGIPTVPSPSPSAKVFVE